MTLGSVQAKVPSLDEIRAWGATVDVPTAGTAFGFGRNKSYDLVKAGEFPARVLKIGNNYRVIVSELLAVLEATSPTAVAG